jgi:single-strand DNA-binding protein
MSGSVNKVILVGNLGADPEIRSLGASGGECANLRIATSEQWKDRDSGEKRERTEWHSVVIFNENLVKVAKQYLHKGSKAYLEGKQQTRKWTDREGVERYSTETVLQGFDAKLVLLDRAQSDPGRHDYSGHQDEGRGGAGTWQGGATGGAAKPGGGARKPDPFDAGDLDDDVPF